jgi:hypothetical protein
MPIGFRHVEEGYGDYVDSSVYGLENRVTCTCGCIIYSIGSSFGSTM